MHKTLWPGCTVKIGDRPEVKPISYRLKGYFVGWGGVELVKKCTSA